MQIFAVILMTFFSVIAIARSYYTSKAKYALGKLNLDEQKLLWKLYNMSVIEDIGMANRRDLMLLGLEQIAEKAVELGLLKKERSPDGIEMEDMFTVYGFISIAAFAILARKFDASEN